MENEFEVAKTRFLNAIEQLYKIKPNEAIYTLNWSANAIEKHSLNKPQEGT